MRLMLALSGPVGVGKSSFTRILEQRFGAVVHSTRAMLATRGTAANRKDLQDAGETADRETDGSWVADELTKILSAEPDQVVIVDAIRIKKQVDHIRRTFGAQWRVWHVFIDADDAVLAERYAARENKIEESPNTIG